MDLEGDGRRTASGQQGTGSGQQGTGSGQLGLASETRGEAEERIAFQVAIDESAHEAARGQGHDESSQESDEEDRQSQAASLANTADGSIDLQVVMPEKPPICFLCSLSADSPNPLVDAEELVEGSYRPWFSYNKVRSRGVVIGKKPTGCVCRICGNVYKTGGFMSQYGKITDYKKSSSKRMGLRSIKSSLQL